MIKTIFTITLLTFTTLINAQESKINDDGIENNNTNYVLKAKMGFSKLELDDYNTINGTISQVDFVLLTGISTKFKIDYGFGFSEFNGNTYTGNKLMPIKNTYLRIPINILYSKEFTSKISMRTGAGVYGNYLLKSDIPNYFNEKNVGLNFGLSFQTGVNFNINESIDLGIILEAQTDISKIKKNEINQKLKGTSLISFNFLYKL
jgi:hypothetical protein